MLGSTGSGKTLSLTWSPTFRLLTFGTSSDMFACNRHSCTRPPHVNLLLIVFYPRIHLGVCYSHRTAHIVAERFPKDAGLPHELRCAGTVAVGSAAARHRFVRLCSTGGPFSFCSYGSSRPLSCCSQVCLALGLQRETASRGMLAKYLQARIVLPTSHPLTHD